MRVQQFTVVVVLTLPLFLAVIAASAHLAWVVAGALPPLLAHTLAGLGLCWMGASLLVWTQPPGGQIRAKAAVKEE